MLGYESIQASLISAGFILGVEGINYVIPVDNRRCDTLRHVCIISDTTHFAGGCGVIKKIVVENGINSVKVILPLITEELRASALPMDCHRRFILYTPPQAGGVFHIMGHSGHIQPGTDISFLFSLHNAMALMSFARSFSGV
ncbi:hypothetical protein [Dickeya poaceiphila]|uniref:Uncharacterized protein n=1 Tax=Dickeya poaceiphila TaxID=568768 RepID=A0A5B8IB17_9GAMM|nr:hypothetical protein [Dickeya poaceiphila]QDX30007.1 hypothetical protein Dpoa569_0001855 [Dickeya poaceiphila]